MIDKLIELDNEYNKVKNKAEFIQLYIYHKNVMFFLSAFLFTTLIVFGLINLYFSMETKEINEYIFSYEHDAHHSFINLSYPGKISEYLTSFENNSFIVEKTKKLTEVAPFIYTFFSTILSFFYFLIFKKRIEFLRKKSILNIDKLQYEHILKLNIFFVVTVAIFLLFSFDNTFLSTFSSFHSFLIVFIIFNLFSLFRSILFVVSTKNKSKKTFENNESILEKRADIRAQSNNIINEIIINESKIEQIINEYEKYYHNKEKRFKIESILEHFERLNKSEIEKQHRVNKFKKSVDNIFNKEENKNVIVND